MAWNSVSLNRNGGSGGPSTLYYYADGGHIERWSKSSGGTTITSTDVPSRECYAFGGYYVTSATKNASYWNNAQVVRASGSLPVGSLTGGTMSATARWTQKSWKITFKANGGSVGTGFAYVRLAAAGGGVFADDQCTIPLQTVAAPTKAGCIFLGYFYYVDQDTPKYVNADGSWTGDYTSMTISRDITLYAHWAEGGYEYTLDRQLGSGGPDKVYLAGNSSQWCSDYTLTTVITSITPPTRDGATFAGYFDAATGGTKYVNADGSFVSGSASSAPRATTTLYAQWQSSAWVIAIDNDGGTGTERLFVSATSGGIFADASCTLAVSTLTPPTLAGYEFLGLFVEDTDEEFVDDTGAFVVDPATYQPGGDVRVYAKWNAIAYTLTLNPNGGTVSPSSISVTYRVPIGSNLPAPPDIKRAGLKFAGWFVNGEQITADTPWPYASDATAVAEWEGLWGTVVDYFGLSTISNSPLVCISSSDGAQVNSVETSHTGGLALQTADSAVGGYSAPVTLLNPTCTYRIKSKGFVAVQLGARKGTATASASGYFITGAEYRTGADQEPLLVVTGTANEGQPAINLYTATFAVDPDHIAQDPFNSVSGGGELVACTSRATCEPVVVYEGLRPCASDVVHGKISVAAQTAAYGGENPPAPKAYYVSKGVTKASEDVDFTTYDITVERGL